MDRERSLSSESRWKRFQIFLPNMKDISE
uniref:Uncharacterized protein n=1 Tax=Arundo donax TaxID=35708 RepID=A0A0A9HHI1_ARUDO